MTYKRIFFFLLMAMTAQLALSQTPVNGYAQISSITGSGTVLNLLTKNETYDTFDVGEFCIVMQMQGASIATSECATDYTCDFGQITNINSSGLYEIGKIIARTPTKITLETALTNTYNTTSGTVQVITYPELGGGGDYTTTFDITALEWTGVFGGVAAFNVSGNLYLAHDVSVDSLGFAWGDKNGDETADAEPCATVGWWIKPATELNAAFKGGGLQNPTSSQVCGRAPIANGGGGGVKHNGGGGGGANWTGGGNGLYGTPGTCYWWLAGSSGAGYGGYSLSYYIAINRIFMGGGGGGGQQNNDKGTHGGEGGGIIIIEADSIFTSCTGTVKISADGNDALSKKNDGQGGGGGGGSIVLFTEYIGATADCPITISASGGDGGDVLHADPHGSGGGGGQGVIFIDAEEMDLMPMDYLTITTANGIGGTNCTIPSDPDYEVAESGDGEDDTGIFYGETPLLPVSLLSFEAILVNQALVNLEWVTATELNCDHYDIYRSDDGEHWTALAQVSGKGTTSETSYYTWPDEAPMPGWNYYILKQVDANGRGVYTKIVQVFVQAPADNLTVFPNPVINQSISIHSSEDLSGAGISLFNLQGQPIPFTIGSSGPHDLTLQTDILPTGYYLLSIKTVQGNLVTYTLLAE